MGQSTLLQGLHGWAQYEYSEEIKDGLLIRRSPEYVYYNLINRLSSWTGNLLGGHKPPPGQLQRSRERELEDIAI